MDDRVSWLFDRSAGTGAVPDSWPAHPGHSRFVGYAGGLRPDNLAGLLPLLGAGGGPYWVDMESGVRDAEDRFDVGLCRLVCEAVFGPPQCLFECMDAVTGRIPAGAPR